MTIPYVAQLYREHLMANIINNNSVAYLRDNQRSNKIDASTTTAASNENESANTSEKDTISMTETAKLLNRANERLSTVSVINQPRVNEIMSNLEQLSARNDFTSVADKVIHYESSIYN